MTKILVIEDASILRLEIMDWLTYEGYEVIGAADGVDGVNAAVANKPDLILCDISMPRLDGYGVLLNIQANSTIQTTPFIFLTAMADMADFRKGMQLGADDYLVKPVEHDTLIASVLTRLNKRARLEIENQEMMAAFNHALAVEYQQRLLQTKLSAMFSHDFRNQLTVILSSVTLVRDYAARLTEQRRLDHLNNIESATRLLLQMLDDMLDIAQMEAGQLEFSFEPLNVSQFIGLIVQEFQVALGVSCRLQFESNFAETVIPAVPRLLRQITSNLISNAAKYSGAGGPVQVALNKHDLVYSLSVTDSGIGIPETDIGRLFDAFQRGSNVGAIAGTGLGLAVVKRAVDLLSGTIEVESHVNSGTKMMVTLPLKSLLKIS